MKKGVILLNDGARIDFIPGMKCDDKKWEAKGAYLRVESEDGKYQGSIDNLPDLKRLKKWVDLMIDSRKRSTGRK